MIYILLIIVAVLGILWFVLSRSKSEKQSSWLQFFARGKDAGFSFKEIELLRKLAAKSNLEDPMSLFWSQKQLDRCISVYLRNVRLSGEDRNQSTQDFLAKLYDYRKKIELNKPRYKKGITSSRFIEEGQPLRILAENLGVYRSRVIKNTEKYMTIARPASPNLPTSFSWNGLKIAVYFWRRDDAGYVFDTYVLDEVYSRGTQSLQISHSDSLFRTQKRKSVRVKTHIAAYLYLPQGNELSDGAETKPGLKCIVEDLSDSGCAVTVGGRAVPGLRVKIQFALDDTPITMTGTVRSSEFNEESGRSLLHIQADPLPMAVRNRILGEVFGLQTDQDYLVPFELLDGEDESAAHAESVQSVGDSNDKEP
ncbi:PilZ domain-containing protein [Breznakiella homolactica]|uniref:PilZ domain-containing protein n=1 Tax=Breznakiella homolactica TaxID=2798577 RepID=A0A7T7XS46_9SPIR|nr:PilZ domain-containing protein [Breznakiella homolactica]